MAARARRRRELGFLLALGAIVVIWYQAHALGGGCGIDVEPERDADTTLGDAGVEPRADSGRPDDGPDRCATAFSTCDTCNQRGGCGFCLTTGECRMDSRRGDCAEWRDGRAECVDCTVRHTECSTCMLDAFCGWCASSNTCLTAAVGGVPPEPPGCADWHYTDVAYCSGP